MERSVIRAAGTSSAVFAVNFATRSRMTLVLTRNFIGGQLDSNGGVSRPAPVSNSSLTILSTGNLYSRPGDPNMGWQVHGGSDAPLPIAGRPGGTSNTQRVFSVGDRIEGFNIGILGMGAHRFTASAGLSSGNLLELDLLDLEIQTPEGGFDLVLTAIITGTDPVLGREYPVGDNNTLRLQMRESSGSGSRANYYSNTLGPVLPENFGTGNRLEIIGSLQDFQISNLGFDGVTPAPEYFQHGSP